MGGGAAVRAAGKLTGMGALNGGLRGGIPAALPAEQALRNVSRPASAVLSTASSSGADVAAIQKVSLWEFAAMEEDLMVEPAPEPIARVVFDVPPTLQEAKDTTADLKEVLDKTYLSSPESSGSKLAPVPPSALFAFKLIIESPAVQSVVVSLVNDNKVWDAVRENNGLKEFMESQRKGGDTAVKFGDTEDYKTGDTEDGKTGDTKGQVNKFFQNVKKSVVYMGSYVPDIFGKTGYTKAQVNKFYQKVNKSVVDMVSNVPYLSSPESSGSKLAPVPPSALFAFKLLSESPAVQSVVVSLVNDNKVWDAVMENNGFKEFRESQRKNAAVEDQESHRMFDESSSDSSPGGDTADEFGDTEDGKDGDTEEGKDGFFQNVKKSVVEMVSNVSDFFQNLFGSSPAEKTSADAGGAGANAGGAGGSFNEKTMGTYLMGLVIMVIMVVVLKRV